MDQRPPPGGENRVDTAHGAVFQTRIVHGDIHVDAGGFLPGVPRQLPLARTPLVGRAELMSRLDDAVSAGSIALLTGTAGVGKTALAVSWANRAVTTFTDGQLYVDLRGYGPDEPLTAHDVLAGFLRALGYRHPDELATTSERAGAFRTVTAGRRILLVLDNARDPAQVRPLLPGSRDCAVVITSRTAMPGLAVYQPVVTLVVDRLGADDGLAVLTEAVGDGTDVDQAEARNLARYCAGLPLALRIAGIRAAGLRPSLGAPGQHADPLDFLDAGGDDRAALRTVFSWSYRALSEQEARAFRAVGVHPSPRFDAHAMAAAIDGTPAQSVTILRTLARHHLLVAGRPDGYETHDLLRAYAAELAPAEHATVLTRLYDYYLDVADRADDLVSPQRLRLKKDKPPRAEPLLPDRRSALSWLDSWLPAVIALCTSADERYDGYKWRLAYAVRGYLYFTKRLDAWIDTHNSALAAAIRTADRWAEGTTRSNLGMALVATRRLSEANVHYETAHDIFAGLGDDHGRAGALANLASVLRRQGALDAALHNQRDALALYRRSGSGRHVCITLRTMASVETDQGQLVEAVDHVEEAISIAVGLDLDLEAAQGFNTLGVIHSRAGNVVQAEIAHHMGVEYSRRADSRHQEAVSFRKLGNAALVGGNPGRAAQWWRAALQLFREAGAREADAVAVDLAGLGKYDT